MMDDRFPPLASQEDLDHENMSEIQHDLVWFAWVVLATVAMVVCGIAFIVWKVLT